MAHNVYICYDERDTEIAGDVCNTLESKGLRCWFKDRDAAVKTSVPEITQAIEDARVMVLIFSKNSKQSNFVNNEVDTAFEKDKKILVFQVDDSELEGGLKFFLRKQPWIDAHADPEGKYDELAKETKRLAKKSIVEIIMDNKIPIIIGVVVIVLIVGYLAFSGNNSETDAKPINVGDVKLKITNFDVNDVRKENTDWNYSYTVEGTISPAPSAGDKYIIVVDFYGKDGSLIESKETPFGEAQPVNSGYLFGSTVSDSNNIGSVDVQLINKDNIILAQDDAQI